MQSAKLLNCGDVFTENVGKAQSNGIELTVDTRRIGKAQFSLSGSYNNAELVEAVPNLGGQDGARIPGVPEFAGSLRVNYHN